MTMRRVQEVVPEFGRPVEADNSFGTRTFRVKRLQRGFLAASIAARRRREIISTASTSSRG
jgi:hypothetical protein